MARPLRIEFPGAVYHITSRGTARKRIFLEEADYRRFLGFLQKSVSKYKWVCMAFCLMPNHFHLLLETPRPNLASGMHYLNGTYAQWFNFKHSSTGHLFGDRYHSIIVDRDNYLLAAARYIVQNPVRAGIAEDPEGWRWSSYTDTAGARCALSFLTVAPLLEQFSRDESRSRLMYRAFVQKKPKQDIWSGLKGGIILGDESYAARLCNDMVPYIKSQGGLLRLNTLLSRTPLDTLIPESHKENRREAINRARAEGYTLKEIGEHLGVHYSRVSQISNGPG